MSLRDIKIRSILLPALLLTFAIHVAAQKDYKIRKISIEGNKTIKDSEIKENMNTKTKSHMAKLKFWEKAPRFSVTTFEDDLLRLTGFYQRNGFLSTHVDYTLQKKEKKKSLQIVLNIKEGESVTINQIGFQLVNDSAKLPASARKEKGPPVKVGDRFQDDKVKAFEEYMKRKYSDQGYPFSAVKNQVTLLPGNKKADLRFSVNPGAICYFGPTRIKNDSLVSKTFIRNQLKYSEGELYSKDQVDKSQKKLFDTDLFQYVVIRTLSDSVKAGRVPISIQVKEKPRWSLEAGAGYGSEDRFRVSTQVTRRQFFGGARKLIFTGKSSYILPLSLDLSFIQPDFLADKLDLIINPFYIKENETSYKVERLGGGFTLQYNFTKFTSLYTMYTFEKDWFSYKSDVEMSTAQQDSLPYNKSGITMGLNTNSANDVFNPSSGIRFTSYLTLMGLGMESKYHYVKLELELRKYFPMANNSVFATRIRTGNMVPIMGDEETPIEDRFMLGGALSLRGWGRNQISPVNENGDLVGGNSMIEASAELRIPVYDILSGAVFMDTGNVWETSTIRDITNLRTDLGIGLRVNTPIGPLRVDFATPVFEGQFNGIYFFSIGHAF
jgi:outer membrane protein assembly complex protein YaeT